MAIRQVVFTHAEKFRDMGARFAHAIDRLIADQATDEDGNTFLEMLEAALPHNSIIYPHETESRVGTDGSVTFEVIVMDIEAQA